MIRDSQIGAVIRTALQHQGILMLMIVRDRGKWATSAKNPDRSFTCENAADPIEAIFRCLVEYKDRPHVTLMATDPVAGWLIRNVLSFGHCQRIVISQMQDQWQVSLALPSGNYYNVETDPDPIKAIRKCLAPYQQTPIDLFGHLRVPYVETDRLHHSIA